MTVKKPTILQAGVAAFGRAFVDNFDRRGMLARYRHCLRWPAFLTRTILRCFLFSTSLLPFVGALISTWSGANQAQAGAASELIGSLMHPHSIRPMARETMERLLSEFDRGGEYVDFRAPPTSTANIRPFPVQSVDREMPEHFRFATTVVNRTFEASREALGTYPGPNRGALVIWFARKGAAITGLKQIDQFIEQVVIEIPEALLRKEPQARFTSIMVKVKWHHETAWRPRPRLSPQSLSEMFSALLNQQVEQVSGLQRILQEEVSWFSQTLYRVNREASPEALAELLRRILTAWGH